MAALLEWYVEGEIEGPFSFVAFSCVQFVPRRLERANAAIVARVIKLNNIMGRFTVRLPARLAHHSDSSHGGSCAPSFRFESESDSRRLISLAPSALPLFACPTDERRKEGRKRKKERRV